MPGAVERMDGTFGFPKGESASKEVIEAIRKEQILQKPTIPPGKTAQTAPTAQKSTVTPGKRVPNPDIVREQLLKKSGWNVSITRNPRSLRLVLMPHNTDRDIEEFLQDLRKLTADL